jgi:hypothetical protein
MPIDLTNIKGPGKGETALSLIGTLANLAGRVLTGSNVDFGEPFNMGAQYLAHKRQTQGLMDLLSSTPHTKPLVDLGVAVDQANQGGQVPEVPSPITPINGPIGGPQPNQQSPLLSTIGKLNQPESQPSSPQTETQLSSSSVNYNDPALIAGLGKVFGPEFGAQLVASQIKQEANPLQQILAGLTIKQKAQDLAETPAEKFAREEQTKQADRMAAIEASKGVAGQTAKENREFKLAETSPQEAQRVNAGDAAMVHLQALPDQIPGSLISAAITAKRFGKPIGSVVNADYPKILENVNAANMQYQQMLERSRPGPKLFEVVKDVLPDLSGLSPMHPEVWGNMKAQALARVRLLQMLTAKQLAERGKTQNGLPASDPQSVPWMNGEDQARLNKFLAAFEKIGPKSLTPILPDGNPNPIYEYAKEKGIENIIPSSKPVLANP